MRTLLLAALLPVATTILLPAQAEAVREATDAVCAASLGTGLGSRRAVRAPKL